ncbi:MAG: efflux RND transporter periplasmic adaptor subunit [Planctomycetes bacterium]|nr:efflux RND transporter periplasmic adaptor subunit [Planctomycetota bacterium]
MKRLIIVAIVGGLAFAACRPLVSKFQAGSKPNWRTAKVSRGRVLFDVRATGTIEPVLKVRIGSFVSGPITDVLTDFNAQVKKGDLLARVDPRLFKAAVARDSASLETRKADVERVSALYQQSVRNERRAIALREENEDFISPREMDTFHFNRLSLEAQLKVAKASIKQAEAALETSRANLNYTEIRSPVEGMVIDRKIDQGQTLAAQFQTPELFVLAPDMKKKMLVFASVDEADVGRIIQAQKTGLPVEFKVSAYPEDTFYGKIEQIRKNATTTENVVTYPVVVAAPNPDLKLLPGMTASLSFQVDQRKDVLRVPNAALRFYPNNRLLVREEDRDLFDGEEEEDDDADIEETHLTEEQKEKRKHKRAKRHVWMKEGDFLKAVQIEIGLVGWKHSEMVEGELEKDDELVIGEHIGEQ